MFRVIIAGGRDFSDYRLLERTVDGFLSGRGGEEIAILCGKARGADALGERYARSRGYRLQYYPADWERYGRAAGCIRNQEMAQNADALVAFWDGMSRGTGHMIGAARRRRLTVLIQPYERTGREDRW